MPRYIVESYGSAGSVDDQRERAERAAEQGGEIRYLRTTIVPADQTLLHVFEAASAEALSHAVEIAGLGCDRIVEVVDAAPAPDTSPAPPVGPAPTTFQRTGSER